MPVAILDAKPPVAVAADQGRLAWLRPLGGGRTQLVVRDPGGAPRVVGVTLPARADQLSLGTDAQNRPAVVISALDAGKRGHRNSLWAVGVGAGAPAVARKLPA